MSQNSASENIHDPIGVGFGPSNLALAIVLEELAETNGHALDALFIDKQTDYRWHGNTLAIQSELLAPLQQHLKDFEVGRDYRALASAEFGAGVYLQGFCEASHGLSDTLLSVLPARAQEIGQSLYQHLGKHASSAPAALRATSA